MKICTKPGDPGSLITPGPFMGGEDYSPTEQDEGYIDRA